MIFAMSKPAPSLNLLDRFLIMMKQKKLPCVICFNKQDIAEEAERRLLEETYEKCGCRVLFVSALKEEGVEELREVLKHRTTTVAGPSGVGKSSIVNRLQGSAVMETGDISRKAERGRRTTRHSELLAMGDGTYIMDTPGFSSLGVFELEKEELAEFYPEFRPYEPECRFQGCSHISEPVCGVKDALAKGLISAERYENYRLLYEELKLRKKEYKNDRS